TADDVRRLVGPMVAAYGEWIEAQGRRKVDGKKRQQVAAKLLDDAGRARDRMAAGLDALSDPAVMEAFRIANRCVARAIRQRACHGAAGKRPDDVEAPKWYPFQLAFLLLNIPGMAKPEHADRRTVDLLFFPTGGGKTEAYLGLAAFAIALRRLRDPSLRSSGVTVLMRYTLRLLTLDQLSRAATLVCALELERQKDVTKLGTWPIEIGLWVGQTATPNKMGRKGDDDRHTARSKVRAFKREPKAKPSPIPLENCPWCGARFVADSFNLLPDDDQPEQLRISCLSRECEFHPRRQREGLPLHAVDEPIYRRLPAFVIATVDKFASLPWIGKTGALLGRVDRHDAKGFYGDAEPGRGTPLGGPLNPPDLIIQDELHLISGPLGTMVGLYETAIDALCGRPAGAEGLRPKIVASTATVRRAQSQIRALFGRPDVEVFPPPGPDRRDTFFSKTRPALDGGARQYLGVAAQGRNLKVVLMRTYLALLAAGKKAWDEARRRKVEPNPADPYMTLVGYFNSLRELGGSRRIVEDEVTARLQDYGDRRRRVEDPEPLFANRPRLTQPAELTSREPTNKVAETKRCLALPHGDSDHLDVALATNMISVGLDITRLGLMVVTGQPKSAAEYIQATSRVGRDPERPGLVVTLLNIHRPRDRSHYERFGTWHASFYRAVEATSVTPFSSRAVDRGLAAVAVALARHGRAELTGARGAERIGKHRGELDFVLDAICRRAEAHVPMGDGEARALRQTLRKRTADLLDSWATIAQQAGQLQYQREEGSAPPLLREPMHPDLPRLTARQRKFRAGWSLRDVEPSVKLRRVDIEDAAVEEDPWQ
ncbi:MAG: DISARM system helicase DrmA, partial [Planctomycetes bacterium]|nr:DISARM system helicase DrmA [Planctomycetota bacterium]